jgi:hypothetical protein
MSLVRLTITGSESEKECNSINWPLFWDSERKKEEISTANTACFLGGGGGGGGGRKKKNQVNKKYIKGKGIPQIKKN